jgi:hypothetical protein
MMFIGLFHLSFVLRLTHTTKRKTKANELTRLLVRVTIFHQSVAKIQEILSNIMLRIYTNIIKLKSLFV